MIPAVSRASAAASRPRVARGQTSSDRPTPRRRRRCRRPAADPDPRAAAVGQDQRQQAKAASTSTPPGEASSAAIRAAGRGSKDVAPTMTIEVRADEGIAGRQRVLVVLRRRGQAARLPEGVGVLLERARVVRARIAESGQPRPAGDEVHEDTRLTAATSSRRAGISRLHRRTPVRTHGLRPARGLGRSLDARSRRDRSQPAACSTKTPEGRRSGSGGAGRSRSTRCTRGR